MSFRKELITNKDGQVDLGKLKQVNKLTATVNSHGYSSLRTWIINDYSRHVTFGSPLRGNKNPLHFKEGDTLSLPIIG